MTADLVNGRCALSWLSWTPSSVIAIDYKLRLLRNGCSPVRLSRRPSYLLSSITRVSHVRRIVSVTFSLHSHHVCRIASVALSAVVAAVVSVLANPYAGLAAGGATLAVLHLASQRTCGGSAGPRPRPSKTSSHPVALNPEEKTPFRLVEREVSHACHELVIAALPHIDPPLDLLYMLL